MTALHGGAHPNRELLALLNEGDALEVQLRAAIEETECSPSGCALDAAEKRVAALFAKQRELWGRIARTPARTPSHSAFVDHEDMMEQICRGELTGLVGINYEPAQE